MSLLPYLRERNIRPKVQKEITFYHNFNFNNIAEYQLNKFNQLWKNIQSNVLYYKELTNNNEVPKTIKSFEDFKKLPIIDLFFRNY